MIAADHTPVLYQHESRSAHPGRAWARRIVVLVAGCAAMALSGGGLAGYLDLSSATAAPAASADAAPLN